MSNKNRIAFVALILVIIASVTALGVFADDGGKVNPGQVKLNIEACNLSFEESVHIIYAVSYEGVEASDVKMLYWTAPKKHKKDYTVDNAEFVGESIGKVTVSGKTCRVFENENMWAKNMTDTLYARAYAEIDGEVFYSEVVNYSILEYAYNKLGHTGSPTDNERLRELINELLEYGAKTQGYFNHNTDHLPTDKHGKVEVNGGHHEDGMSHGFYKEDTEITLTAVTTPDKPYVKWTDADGNVVGYGETITVKVSGTSASYTAECYALYTVSFVDSDGTVISTVDELLLGDSITVPAMSEREGYTFLGWSTSKGGSVVYSPSVSEIVMGADATDKYYAVWLPDDIEGTEGLVYSGPYTDENDDQYYVVTGYEGTAADVVVGNTYNGLPVREISGQAFRENNTVRSVTVADGITKIGDLVFYMATAIETVQLPESVTYLGQQMFEGCTSLTEIALPDSITYIGHNAFYDCTSLASVNIPSSLKVINGGMFNNTAITSVVIPNSVDIIDSTAFSGCSALESVTLGSGVKTIGGSAFSSCSALKEIAFPNGLTEIGEWAFFGCSALTSLTIPDNVVSIGELAFADCSSLTSITVGTGLRSVGQGAFSGCSLLNTVNITDIHNWYRIEFDREWANPLSYAHDLKVNGVGVTEVVIADGTERIGAYAFAGLSTLTGVTIPESVTEIGDGAFCCCISLDGVTLPSGITSIGKDTFRGCEKLKSIVIPDAVTEIGDSAFNFCGSLTSVSFGEASRLTGIGNYAFYYTAITDIVIPDGVTEIGEYAFYCCDDLTEIIIPDGVTAIYASAFERCSSLETVYIPESVTLVGYNVFYQCTKANIFVEAESAGLEWNSSWCDPNCAVIWGYECAATEDGFEYAIGAEGAFVLGYTGAETELTIPATLGGRRVVEIANRAFYGCSTLTSVTLPDGVTVIGAYAFYDCSSLEEIVIPDSVVRINICAFVGCRALKTLFIPDSVLVVEYNQFMNGSWELVVLCEAKSQPEGWSSGWNSDRAVIWGFEYASQTADGYEYAVSQDGVTILRYVGSDTELAVPAEIDGRRVVAIATRAFSGCSTLTSVTIPDSVVTIGEFAFEGCYGLKTLFIPDSVLVVERMLVTNCSDVTVLCEAESQPEGWSSEWNCYGRPVVWGVTPENAE